jgi:hypothetical protein
MEKGDAVNENINDDVVYFDITKRIITIRIGDIEINLDLPHSLAVDMIKLEEISPSPIWLFADEKANQLTTSYFELSRVKKHAEIFFKDDNHIDINTKCFTLEGIAKFGIINQLEAGINPLIVKKITGAKDDVLNYCQEEAVQLIAGGDYGKQALNRFINSRIRSVSAYEDFQQIAL